MASISLPGSHTMISGGTVRPSGQVLSCETIVEFCLPEEFPFEVPQRYLNHIKVGCISEERFKCRCSGDNKAFASNPVRYLFVRQFNLVSQTLIQRMEEELGEKSESYKLSNSWYKHGERREDKVINSPIASIRLTPDLCSYVHQASSGPYGGFCFSEADKAIVDRTLERVWREMGGKTAQICPAVERIKEIRELFPKSMPNPIVGIILEFTTIKLLTK